MGAESSADAAADHAPDLTPGAVVPPTVPGPRGARPPATYPFDLPTAPRPTISSALASVETPEPRLRQLIGVCGWAAVLGGVGLVIGLRGYIGVLVGAAPDWYEPAFAILGFIGIALTIGAFLTVHRPRPPWIMLGLSSASLVAVMILTAIAY